MKKLKQILCIALTFVFMGGCAQMKKADALPDESTLTEASDTVSQTQELTARMPDTAETEQTATSALTETGTTRQQITAKHTEAATTAKQTASTKAAATKATTAKVTETAASTTAATTEAVPVQSEDGIIIGLKKAVFGSSRQEVTDTFGSPTETVTEKLTSGGTVTSLVYAADYSRFAVFLFLNGKLLGFYTCAEDTLVTDGKEFYSLRTGGRTQIGGVEITEYADNSKNGRVYAFKASFNGFDYAPAELEAYEGQERLIYHTTNAVRSINGVSSLAYSEKAADCVLAHCKDMSARDYFSHDTPEGVTGAQRMRNCGIEYGCCGENLAAGYMDAYGLVDGWYNSSGHRKNLLDNDFRYIGVGVAEGNSSYVIYAGQNYFG